MDLLKKIDNAITKVFFSKLWILVDIMVWFNIGVGLLNGDISTGGTGLLIYCVYYLICDQIRLEYRLRLCEDLLKVGEKNDKRRIYFLCR